MRIDSHQHFWTLARSDYGWLTPDAGPIYRDFQPCDLRPMLRETGVQRTVAVQAAPSVSETRYLLALAHREDFVAGVVGWVDMNRPDQALADLEQLARDDALLGIRPMIQDIQDASWMLSPAPAAVFEHLVDFNLRFDALVRPGHLPHLRELLARYPELPTVVDHGAKPEIAQKGWQPWADHMAALGEETGAFCKLSGLLTEADANDTYEELFPYMDHMYQCFGPERLMWGSDWPVLNLAMPLARRSRQVAGLALQDSDPLAAAYLAWNAMVRRWLEGKGSAARQAVEGAAAIRFYGLD